MENMEHQDRANRSVVVFNDGNEPQEQEQEVMGDQSMTDRRSAGGSQFALKRKNSEASMGSRSVYKRASMVGPAPPKLSRSVLGGSFFKKDPGLKR